MAATVSLKLDKRFKRLAIGRYEKYGFLVGVLKDRPHRAAVSKAKGLKSYAGGPARKIGRKAYGTVAGVSERLRKHLGINFYTRPFKSRKNIEINRFARAFFQTAGKRGSQRRLINLLQAIVRNPILRGDYGKNSRKTADQKGFNRLMIDTAQLFKAITAQIVVMRRVS